MNHLKIRAMAITCWIFAGLALVIALGQLAVAYQGTEALRVAGMGLALSALAWCVYRIVLSHLEDDDETVRLATERVRLEAELARLKNAK